MAEIKIKRRDAQTVEPDQLIEYLSTVYGLRSAKYAPGNVPGAGILFLTVDKNYDIQEVGYRISDAGYNVLIDTTPSPRADKPRLERIVSRLEDTFYETKQTIRSRVQRFLNNRHLQDLVRKNLRKGGAK